MKLKNKILLCICILFVIGIIINCGVFASKNNIYNNNEKIVKEDYSYNYTNSIGESSNDKMDMKYSGFYGTDTIWILEVKEESEITFNYDSIVDSGNFKAVLINNKEEIENISEGTEQGNKTIKLAKGKYKFKLVGRDAEGEINISINKNNNVGITNFDNK